MLVLVFGLPWFVTNVHGQDGGYPNFSYGREFLLNLRNAGNSDTYFSSIVFPTYMLPTLPQCSDDTERDQTKHKKRRKGGIPQKLKKMAKQGCNTMSLPTVVLSSVRSLRSETDELQATVNYIHECKNACLLAFTETWLNGNVHDNEWFIDGFGTPIHLDRNSSATRKSHGGGVCLYVNRKWCNIITVRDTLCTLDIELLTVSLQPFYSPREFPRLFFTVVYIHPCANASRVAESLSSSIHRLDSLSPDASKFILDYFNQFKMGKTLKHCHQYVTCATRHNKI